MFDVAARAAITPAWRAYRRARTAGTLRQYRIMPIDRLTTFLPFLLWTMATPHQRTWTRDEPLQQACLYNTHLIL